MIKWFKNNASAFEALGALMTALVALAALIGVKYQLDSAEKISQSQTARDAYRAHLALAVAHPDFAYPQDQCALLTGADAGSYQAFVDHLLYSAEQMLEVEEGWKSTFTSHLETHSAYICAPEAPISGTEKLLALLAEFSAQHCTTAPSCINQ